MSPEERERMMQFLLNQQAQFDANHAKSLKRLDRVEDAILTVVGAMGRMAKQQDQRHAELTASLAELRAAQARTDQQLMELGEASTRTGERLDIVVNMFERHLREDHGTH